MTDEHLRDLMERSRTLAKDLLDYGRSQMAPRDSEGMLFGCYSQVLGVAGVLESIAIEEAHAFQQFLADHCARCGHERHDLRRRASHGMRDPTWCGAQLYGGRLHNGFYEFCGCTDWEPIGLCPLHGKAKGPWPARNCPECRAEIDRTFAGRSGHG